MFNGFILFYAQYVFTISLCATINAQYDASLSTTYYNSKIMFSYICQLRNKSFVILFEIFGQLIALRNRKYDFAIK